MISAERIAEVAARVRAAGVDESILAELRRDFAGTHFSYCMDDDVGSATPIHQEQGFNLYLVDGRDHCMRLTTEPGHATGILLAAVVE